MTTIGRVEFIVGLDGNRLPAQARRLAKQMEEAGTRAGDSFSDAFESRFDKNLSKIGDRFATSLGRSGRLAGSTFSDDFEGVVQNRFRRVQQNLAEVLADKEAFADFARGFSNVGEAVDQLNADLERVRTQTVQYTDENGNLRERLVLTANQARDFGTEIRRLGAETEDLLTKERSLQEATADLDANYARLTRTVGDSDAFTQMAARVGGSEEAFTRLKREIEETGTTMGRSRIEIEEYVDRLERTRETVDRVAEADHRAALAALAKADAMKDARFAADSLAHSNVDLDESNGRLERSFRKLGVLVAKPWTNLDRDVRLVIGLIASAGDQVAVLGSALGAGLIGLGAAASQGIVGIGGLAAVAVTLGKDLGDLPPHLRAVKIEFEDFTNSLTEAREVIATGAFAEMDGVFVDLASTVRALSPEFEALGTSVGRVFSGFAAAVRPGTAAFNEISELIDNSGEGFESLAGSAGTFGLAFVRSFNRAQPLVEDLYGWIGLLADRFDAFSRSDGFDTWISNAQRVFGSFGNLLDEVGRGLNDLATPGAVQRTTDLLDNLAGFTPNLIAMLDILGRLDPLGLLAATLNDVGNALEPLAGPAGELADALNRLLAISLERFAHNLELIAIVTAPLAEGLARFIDAIPEGALIVATDAVFALGTAFLALKGAGAIGAAITALDGFVTKSAAAAGASTALAGKLSTGLGRAGIAGAAVVGVLALSEALDDLYRSATKVDDKSRNIVASNSSLASAYEQLGGSVFGVLPPLNDVDAALDNLTGSGVEGMIGGIGNAFREGGGAANALSQTLSELSGPLASLATTDLPAAQQAFAGWATELGANDAQILNMINTMPAFKEALIGIAEQSQLAATDSNLLAIAMGTISPAALGAAAGIDGASNSSLNATGQVNALTGALSEAANQMFATRDSGRAYEEALDTLSESIATNGNTLDITTEAGRNNEQAVDDLAQALINHAEQTRKDTGSVEASNAVIQAGREDLINQATAFFGSRDAAAAYIDKLLSTPTSISTGVVLNGVSAAEWELTQLARDRQVTIRVSTQSDAWFPGVDRPTATGGTFFGPSRRLIGEAGPEAVVPLDRPLSLVDPSVRMLSAIAQGLAHPMAAGGVVAGAGTHIDTINLTVITDDPETAGESVLDALSQNLNG